MTEQYPSSVGTVAQEAARLIEDMTLMARSGYRRDDDTGPYAGEPAPEYVSPTARGDAGFTARGDAGPTARGDDGPTARADGHSESTDEPGACSLCGAGRDSIPEDIPDDTPATCKLCPLCRGIAVLRSVRPETVDLLADLALSVAASLREVATRSRASHPTAGTSGRSSTSSSSGAPTGPDHAPVQDIPVNDECEG